MRQRTSIIAILVASLLVASPAWAQLTLQRSLVTSADLDAAMVAKTADADAKRALVVSVLHDDRVQALADQLSLDLVRAEQAVATLGGDDLTAAAESATAIQSQLSGEARVVTISVTTLLLILLIVLLVAD